jgi:importin subunit beta-1
MMLQTLLSPEQKARDTAAQCIGAVAAIDLPCKQWTGQQGIVAMILQCVTATQGVPEESKEAALKACGFMCEELEADNLNEDERNQILTAIVDGIKAGRPDNTRVAAVEALINSLDFCAENFNRATERNMLMQVVCEATQSQDVRVRKKAYECLGCIVELYYDHLSQECKLQI